MQYPTYHRCLPLVSFAIPLQFIDFGFSELLEDRCELLHRFFFSEDGGDFGEEARAEILIMDRTAIVAVTDQVEAFRVNLYLLSN